MAIIEIILEDVDGDNPLCKSNGLERGLMVYTKAIQQKEGEHICESHAMKVGHLLLELCRDPNFLAQALGIPMGAPIEVKKEGLH